MLCRMCGPPDRPDHPSHCVAGVVPSLGVQLAGAPLPAARRPPGAALQIRVPLRGAEVPLLPARGPRAGVPHTVCRGADLPVRG